MTIASLIVDVQANTAQLVRGVDDIHGRLDDLNGVAKNFAVGLAEAFTASAVVEGMKRLIDGAIRYADQLSNLSVATSITVEGLQDLEAIGITAGVSLETMAKAVEMLHRKLDDRAAIQAVADMGLNYYTIRNLKPEDQFLEIAKSVAKIQDPVERANAGAALFGKTWDTVSAALQGDVEANINSVHKLTDEQVHALDRIGDAWDLITLSAKRYSAELVLMTMPKGMSPWLQGALSGGLLDSSLNGALPKLPNAPGGLFYQDPLGNMQLPDLKSKLNGQTTLADELDAANTKVQDAKRFAKEWAAALLDARDNWHAIFREVELATIPLIRIGNGMSKPRTDMGVDGGGYAAAMINLTGRFNIGDSRGMAQANGITDIRQAARENIAAAHGSLLSGIGASVPQAIIGSFEGGGNAAKSALGTIGNKLGSNMVARFGQSITENLGKTFGGAINAVLPGLGALAAPLINLVGKLFGKSEESSKVSPVRDEFFKMHGGLEALNPKVLELTGSLTLVDNIFKAKTVDAYNAAIKDLTDALAFQDKAMQTLTDTAQKYGFTLEELGPALQRQDLDKQAQQLYQDWQVLNAGGLDHVAILTHMADSVNQYVHNALSMGVEVPNAMRPMLEDMAKSGQLLDLNGNKIEDLQSSGISFAMTMSEGFTKLISEVQKLTDAISRGLGLAIQNMPDADFTIRGHVQLPDNIPSEMQIPNIEGFAGGTHGMFRDFGRGTPVILHGKERVMTEREGGGQGSPDVVAELREMKNELPRMIRDAVLLAVA